MRDRRREAKPAIMPAVFRQKGFRRIFWLWIFLLFSNLCLYVTSPEVLTAVGAHLVVEDPLKKADAIVVYGGGVGVERLKHAVDLYKKGYSDKILLSGGVGSGTNPRSWAVRLKDQAIRMGVPAEAVWLDEKGESTYDNAVYAVNMFRENGWKTGIIVSSPYHMRRSMWTTREAAAEAQLPVEWIASPSTTSPFAPDTWWRNGRMRELIVGEYVKMVGYWIRY